MKRHITPGLIATAVLLIGLGVFYWETPLQGERDAGLGSVYFFSDGFVAKDTSRSPNEFYIVELDPKVVSDVSIDMDGLVIRLNRTLPEFDLPVDTVSTMRPDPAHVNVFREMSRQLAWRNEELDTARIENLIEQRDWGNSIRNIIHN